MAEMLMSYTCATYIDCSKISIRECGSTLYVGMIRVVSFSLYIGIGAKFRNRLKTAKTSLCRVKDRTAML